MATPLPHNERLATLLALTAVLLWSTVATAFKLGLTVLTPLQLLLQGVAFSSLLFIVVNTAAGTWRITPALAGRAAGLGLLNPLLYYPILFAAYEQLPAQVAQAVNYTWAITLAILAWPVLGQRLQPRSLTGIGISYAGVLVILGGVDAQPDLSWGWSGVLLAFVSTFVWALYWLLNARSTAAPLPLMTWSFLFATPAIAILCGLIDGWPAWNRSTVPYGLWVGAVEMGVAFLLWQAALNRSRQSGRLGQLILLAPFISLLLIERVLHEPVPTTSWIGLVIVVAGLLLTQSPRARGS